MGPAYYIAIGLLFVGAITFLDLYRRKLRQGEDSALRQELDGRLFPCVLMGSPRVSGVDLAMGGVVGASGLAAMKFGLARAGRAFLKEGHFIVDTIDPNNVSARLEMARIPATQIGRASLFVDEIRAQLKRLAVTGAVAGLSFGGLLAGVILYRVGFDHPKALFALAFGLVGGLVIGLLFAVLPNLFRLRQGRRVLVLENSEGLALGCVGINREHVDEALKVLAAMGIPVQQKDPTPQAAST